MPFGLTNAPRSFQRTMLSILGDLRYVKVYIDDVLVHTKKDENHKNHVIEEIKRLNEAGMTINLDKCKFSQIKIEYLGHYITPNGYFPKIDKVEIYKNRNLPNTKR
ncbi:Transposon Tf2-9 polyprotein [Dictyocoela muelleri]|nr:Transposon Tf2-9 polyprotein [Dictyocoela muelleri]